MPLAYFLEIPLRNIIDLTFLRLAWTTSPPVTSLTDWRFAA
jgi:hypothetical protein